MLEGVSAESVLQAFVSAPDEALSWGVASKRGRTTTISLTSQRWQGQEWRHDLVVVEPRRSKAREHLILYLTGGEPNPLDHSEAQTLADMSGLAVAHLFQVPNQPLFDLVEDELIAHTFMRFIETGDPSWPLLLPMTKSAARAMDALQAWRPGVRRFIVTGASKRGWTAWLCAATGDPRVAGVAPMVYDNLNIPAQLRRQVECWGEYSEMLSPYTALGLERHVGQTVGDRLVQIVDPYSYRDALVLPKLVITGSDDPYWATDATGLYWEGLTGPKWASVVPNAGHELGDKAQALQAIAAFAKAVARGASLPLASWSWESDAVALKCEKPFPQLRLWVADSESCDFRTARWSVRAEAGGSPKRCSELSVRLPLPRTRRNQAAIVEMRYGQGETPFSLTTPIRLYPPAIA